MRVSVGASDGKLICVKFLFQWLSLIPPLSHKPFLLFGVGNVQLLDGDSYGGLGIGSFHRPRIKRRRASNPEYPPCVELLGHGR